MTVTKTPARAVSASSGVVRNLPLVSRPTAAQLFEAAQLRGRQHRKPLVVDSYLLPVLETVCYYFAQDPVFTTLGDGFSLDKGLLLFGPVGCGKTRLLELMFSLDRSLCARVADCDDVARLYKQHGDEALNTFCQPGRLLLDDIGVDDTKARHYANGANPVGDVLRRRYRLWEAGRALTHGTTNCNAETLEALYQDRICDRMADMFNIVAFDENTPSRRQYAPTPLPADGI